VSDSPKEDNGVWKLIATSLISAALVFFTTLAINGTKSEPPAEPKQLIDNIVYIKEAIRMIFENESMILMYVKVILKREGIPLE